MSSTCFEHPSVHPQEDLYMQFYISFVDPYIQHQAHPAIDQTASRDASKKYHTTEDEHLNVRKRSKTNLTFRGRWIVIYSYNETNEMH